MMSKPPRTLTEDQIDRLRRDILVDERDPYWTLDWGILIPEMVRNVEQQVALGLSDDDVRRAVSQTIAIRQAFDRDPNDRHTEALSSRFSRAYDVILKFVRGGLEDAAAS